MDPETRAYLRELRALRRARRQTEKRRAEAATVVAAFNAAHPVGTPVRFWTWTREGQGRPGQIRAPAEVAACGTPVAWVTGHAAYIALTHVEALT